MPEVLLSSNDLTVLGGPAEITLALEIGPSGDRGSSFFSGNGKPTDQPLAFPSSGVKFYDLYLNLNPTDNEYLFLYQYLSVNGVLQWTKIVKLIPNTGFYNTEVTFENGIAHSIIGSNISVPAVFLPLATLIDLDSYSEIASSDLNVQANILSERPVSLGTQIMEISDTYTHQGTEISLGALYLPVSINAVQLSETGTSWDFIDESRDVHFNVSVAVS